MRAQLAIPETRVTDAIGIWVLSISDNPYVFLLLANVFLLFVGCFMMGIMAWQTNTEPLYSLRDAIAVQDLVVGVPYHRVFYLRKHMALEFLEAGQPEAQRVGISAHQHPEVPVVPVHLADRVGLILVEGATDAQLQTMAAGARQAALAAEAASVKGPSLVRGRGSGAAGERGG